MFHKILIANRGEIALRIIRTCREMGIRSVVAYSQADAHSLPVRVADESICVGPNDPRASYLNIPAIISAAAVTDSEAIHPGYGFLAESPTFADICRACGISFIGPSPETIRLMGDKVQARQIAKQVGVPVAPGSERPLMNGDDALEAAEAIGYPIIFKAAAGGGGRGMRIVRERSGVVQAFASCQSEAGAAFGNSEIYCEQFVEGARHVEVQVLADRNGTRVHLGERDCSVQRRHQKLIEESPAPHLRHETRAGLDRAALTVAGAVNYVNAGTVEFLVDADENFCFIEMNTRIRFDGHAIECRINAEDPDTFAPSAGRVTAWLPPGGFGVRVDSHLMVPYSVPPFYDSLIAKVIVHGRDRGEAIERMRRALGETVVEGVRTTIPYHLKTLGDPAFAEGRFTGDDGARLHR